MSETLDIIFLGGPKHGERIVLNFAGVGRTKLIVPMIDRPALMRSMEENETTDFVQDLVITKYEYKIERTSDGLHAIAIFGEVKLSYIMDIVFNNMETFPELYQRAIPS